MGCTPSKIVADELPKSEEEGNEVEIVTDNKKEDKPIKNKQDDHRGNNKKSQNEEGPKGGKKSPRNGNECTAVEAISMNSDNKVFEKEEKVFIESDSSDNEESHSLNASSRKNFNIRPIEMKNRSERKRDVLTTEKLFIKSLDLSLNTAVVSKIDNDIYDKMPLKQIQIYTPEKMHVSVTANSKNSNEFTCVIVKGKSNEFPIYGDAEEFEPMVHSQNGSVKFEIISQGIPGFVLSFVSTEKCIVDVQIAGITQPILSINYTEPLLD